MMSTKKMEDIGPEGGLTHEVGNLFDVEKDEACFQGDSPKNPMEDATFTSVRQLQAYAENEMKQEYKLLMEKQHDKVASEYILDLTRDIHRIGEKKASNYLARTKDFLLSDHAEMVKRQDIFVMRDMAQSYEDMLAAEEAKLETDALNFSEFIKATNDATVTAIEKVYKETKIKMEKVEKIREVYGTIFSLKSSMARLERMVLDYILCARFLKEIVPEGGTIIQAHDPFLEEAQKRRKYGIEIVYEYYDEKFLVNDVPVDPIKVPFINASELLKAIGRFRDQNLTIITNSHYLTKAHEDIERNYNSTVESITEEMNSYVEQISEYNKIIEENMNEAERLQQKANICSAQTQKEEDAFIEILSPKVAVTYELCMGVPPGKLSLSMMVAAIESYIVEMLHNIHKLHFKNLIKAYKAKQQERKAQKKKEEEERKANFQREKMRLADLRSAETAEERLSRRMMYQPEQAKRAVGKTKENIQMEMKRLQIEKEEEEYEYFFT